MQFTDPKAIGPAMEKLFSGQWKEGKIPEKGDGQTAERVVDVLLDRIPAEKILEKINPVIR